MSFVASSFCFSWKHPYNVVVVRPTLPPKNGGGVQQPFLLTPESGTAGGPLHSTSRFPTSAGAVQNSVTFSCVFVWVQLNKCVVVCGSDFQRGHSGDGCLSSSNLFKYERSMGHSFVLSWARVRQVALRSVVSA